MANKKAVKTPEYAVQEAFALYEKANKLKKKAEAILAEEFDGMEMCQNVDDFSVVPKRLHVFEGIDALIRKSGEPFVKDDKETRVFVGGIQFFELNDTEKGEGNRS